MVLDITLADQYEGLGVQRMAGWDDFGLAMDQDVGELRPVVGVLVDEQRGFVASLDIAHALELARIDAFRLFVQRDKETCAVAGIADRHGIRMTGCVRGGQASNTLPGDKAFFTFRQHRTAYSHNAYPFLQK